MKKVCFSRRQILRTIRAACIALFFAACAQRAGAQSFNGNDFSVNGTSVTDRGVNDSNSAYFSGSGTYNFSIGNVTLGNSSGTAINNGDLIVTGGGSTVNNAGSLSASNYTILIEGDGTVTNTHSIYATSGSAVYIEGNGTVNNSGTMNSGAAHYWSVNIEGNGTSTVTNSGTMNSGFGVFVNGNGTLNNTGSIYAFNGSGVVFGGNATVTNSGYIGSENGPGVGIHGDGTVNNTGNIAGQTSGSSYYGGVLINGAGGASSVTNSGNITDTSSGQYAAGVVLGGKSVSGNSRFTLTNNGAISGSSSYYGSTSAYGVAASSQFGNITITNNGAITGSATSAAGNYTASAYGISAGSFSGNVTVTNSQTVSGSATSLFNGTGATASAYGIAVYSEFGNVRVTNSGTASGSASGYYAATASGIYAFNVDGNITISNSGQATGSASVSDYNTSATTKGYGISASSYYGDGNISITNDGTATGTGSATYTGGGDSASGYGIFARSSEGNITIVNRGTATGTGSAYYSASGYGILATSFEGNITITNNGTASGYANSLVGTPSSYGINGTSTDGGTVTITNTGAATASSYSGAYNTSSDTSSAYASGIFARSNGGNISITNSGTASGYAGNFGSGSNYGYGMNVHASGSGTITIQNSGNAIGTASSYAGSSSGYGIWLTAGSGAVSINNTITGVISGSGYYRNGTAASFGIYAQQGTGPMTITNRGTISAYYGTGIYTLDYKGDTTVNEIGGAVISIGNPNSYSAGYYSILLGSGTNTVNMVGQVNNTGIVDGGDGGNNTLTLHLAGMTPAQKIALQQAVTNSQGGAYSGAVFAGGVTYAWQEFNSVSGTFVSLEQSVDPGLMDVATKIDNLGTPLPVALGPLLVDAATDPEGALNNFTGREFLNAFVVQGLSETVAISELADNRADALRLGSNGIDFSSLSVNSGSMIASLGNTESVLDHISSTRLGGTTMSDSKEVEVAPSNNSRFAAWVAGTVTIADEDNTGTNPGFTATSGSPSIGIDYRVCDELVVGGLFSFATSGANFSDGSTLNADTELVGLYTDWAHDHWFVNTLIAGGHTSFDQKRTTLAIGGTQALASPDGDQILANVTSGYDFKIGGFVLSPDAGLLYTHLTKDSFNETGAGAFDLNVGEQDVDSLRTKLGFHATRPFTWDSIMFTPEIHATWYHECLDDTNTVNSSVSAAPAIGTFQVTTNPQGRDFAAVGAGLTATPAEWHDNVTFFGNYGAQVGQDNYTAHTVNAGVRVNF